MIEMIEKLQALALSALGTAVELQLNFDHPQHRTHMEIGRWPTTPTTMFVK